MADYLEVNIVSKYKTKDGEEKNRWVKVGVAFPMKNGPGYSLRLDFPIVSLPGVSDLVLAPKKDFDGPKKKNDDVAF